MARPTQQEIDEWEARMAEPEDDSDDDFEVVLFDENGSPVGTMPFKKAKVYFAKRGIELDAPANADSGGASGNAGVNGQNMGTNGAGPGMAQTAPTAPAPRTSSKYFAGRGTRAQATAAIPDNGDPAGNPPR